MIASLLLVVAGATPAAALGVDACVEMALAQSAKVEEAEAKFAQYEARLAEVQSVYYPKLMGTAFVAPMITVTGDIFHYENRYSRLSDWGPYAHLQAVLAQPLYTFGRAEAGERAARARAEVERARIREAENVVALEVKKLFYGRLYAMSMLPALRSAADTANTAITKAEEMYEQGTGEVTQSDLMKLRYAQSEVQRYLRIAQDSAVLAAEALKHTMGVPSSTPLEFAGEQLPQLPDGPEADLAPLLVESSRSRPEWAQLSQGRAATIELESAERLANTPVLFIGGQLTADWAPTRTDAKNPYHNDPYNQVVGDIAIGFLFNIDPALASAKTEGARALGAEVEALRRFAETGIPLQVKKARDELDRYRALVEFSDQGVQAARKWMTFAAAAYTTGTGEARDVLEGLVAYLQARRNYFESIYSYYIARADLDFAVGRH